MMAIETLISTNPRSEHVKVLIDHLITDTSNSDLPQNEKDSIKGSLSWLNNESIGQAGSRLAECLGDKIYFKEYSPRKFFTYCYGIRSNLVHGNDDRP